jgi:S1-C subfamily serine protease
MSDNSDWAFPESLQPRPDRLGFDLSAALDAVVAIRTETPADAFTADVLGTERAGNGAVIGAGGLILTIGYLVTEAETIWITTNSGRTIPGHVLAIDQVTGFGLVQALGKLGTRMLERGSIVDCAVGGDVTVVGQGGRVHALAAKVLAKREFAGYWEYVLDEAIFTAPAHPQWTGSALIGPNGKLLGIGSLLIEERVGKEKVQGNMIVPIDLLEPILDDLLTRGRASGPVRPWLGFYVGEAKDHLVVAGLADNGPAHRAGLRKGDAIIDIAGERVESLADLFRKIWSQGEAGCEVRITVVRDGKAVIARVRSGDRRDFLKKPRLH